MTSKKHIQPDEKVPLKLTAAERRLLLEGVLLLDEGHTQIIRDTPASKPVMMTLDDLDSFGGYVAAEANHCDDKKKERKLDAILQKIQDLLDQYTLLCLCSRACSSRIIRPTESCCPHVQRRS